MKQTSTYLPLAFAALSLLAAACQKAELPVPEPVTDLKAYPGLYRAKVEFSVPSDAVSAKVFHSSGKYVQTEIEDPSAVQSVIVEELSAGCEGRSIAELLSDVVPKVWAQADIQQAASDVDALTQKLREYSAANESEKPALLEDLNAITAAMEVA